MTTFRLATWNVLAPEYVSPSEGRDFYPGVREFLPWKDRMPRIVERVRALDADVVCLQEVSRLHVARMFGALLDRMGYELLLGQRPVPKVDTVAVLARRGRARVTGREDLVLPGESAKVALVVDLSIDDRPLCVTSLHLRWSADGASQTTQLAHYLDALDRRPRVATVFCGDLNFDLQRQPLWNEVIARGFAATHPPAIPTWAADGRSDRLDDIVFRDLLLVRAGAIAPLAPDPGLPNADEPSDHLPLVADFAFAD